MNTKLIQLDLIIIRDGLELSLIFDSRKVTERFVKEGIAELNKLISALD